MNCDFLLFAERKLVSADSVTKAFMIAMLDHKYDNLKEYSLFVKNPSSKLKSKQQRQITIQDDKAKTSYIAIQEDEDDFKAALL